MATEPILDFSAFDPDHPEIDVEAIRAVNPQRFEMEQIDGVGCYAEEPARAVGVRRVKADEFWCRGHFPGDPLFPGVLIIEAAAQVMSYCFHRAHGCASDRVLGFGGVENVRFRGAVRPGDVLLLPVKAVTVRSRVAVFEAQGWVADRLVYEGTIMGITLPSPAAGQRRA